MCTQLGKYILILMFLVSLSSCATHQTESPEDQAVSVFNALKNGDYSLFNKNMYRKEDIVSEVDAIRRLADTSKTVTEKKFKAQFAKREEQIYETIRKSVVLAEQNQKKSFERARALATDLGIKWEDAEIVKMIRGSESDYKGLRNIHMMKIFFISNGNSYRLDVEDIVRVQRGWVSFDGIHGLLKVSLSDTE